MLLSGDHTKIARWRRLESLKRTFNRRPDLLDAVELTEEEEALGEAAKLMTLMNMFKEDEAYEKCAIIKGRMDEVNRILRKGNI